MTFDPTSQGAIEGEAQPSERTAIIPFFPSAVVHLQKRGTITLPPWIRQTLESTEGDRLWLRVGPEDSLQLNTLWGPSTLFRRYDAQVVPLATPMGSTTLPTRWIDAATVLAAQSQPDHPARAWCQECDDGFQPVRMDPVVLQDLLDRIPTLLPTLTRSQCAQYVASVCSWTGVTLADRDFYLGVLALWGSADADWSFLVQRAREAAPI